LAQDDGAMTSRSIAPLPPFIKRNLAAIAVLMLLQWACGGNKSTGPTTTTGGTTGTTGTTSTTGTTGTATTTTTTGTTTTGTTTTGGGGTVNIIVDYTLTNTPCVAPSSGAVSCTFSATASGGTAPYTWAWTINNPANTARFTSTDQNVRPELGCNYSTGQVTFNINVQLTATDSMGRSQNTSVRQQSITRATGACGT
jgi:hypothetical protein